MRFSRNGGAIFMLDRGDGGQHNSLAYDPAVYCPTVITRPTVKESIDFTTIAQAAAADAEPFLPTLAEDLGVPVELLKKLGVGIRDGEWLIPARTPEGEVVGIQTRGSLGGKRSVKGSQFARAAFYLPGEWHQGDGPVVLVEGASDMLALHAAGFATIGRFSARAGLLAIGAMLEDWPADRGVVVLGENDDKPNGDCPGRDGATWLANGLAETLYRDIAVVMPPKGHKDARAWLSAEPDPEKVAGHIAARGVIVPGKPRPHHEDGRPLTGEVVPLDEYRRLLREAKRTAFAAVGLTLDGAPTGAGKSHSANDSLHDIGYAPWPRWRGPAGQPKEKVMVMEPARSLTVMPTHKNLHERRLEMIAAGHDPDKVAIMPELSPDNCAQFALAERVRAAGLSHGSALCWGCEFARGCPYKSESARARNRRHLLITAERFRRSQEAEYIRLRPVVVVDERVDEALSPMVTCTPAEMLALAEFFGKIASETLSLGARSLESWADAQPSPEDAGEARGDRMLDMAFAAQKLEAQAIDLLDAAGRLTAEGAEGFAAGDAGNPPDGWERTVLKMLERGLAPSPPASAMRCLLTLNAEPTARAWVTADHDAAGRLTTQIAVGWQVDLEGRRVLLMDGTADASAIGEMVGQQVRVLTPPGQLPETHSVTQRLCDIPKSQSPRSARAIVAAIIEEMPEHPRIGLIGHKKHVEALLGDSDGPARLCETHRRRITMHSYFGQGPDRGSNEWHRNCDVLLIVGTPRPPAHAVRQAMIRYGARNAARSPRGDFGAITWDAITTDGREIVVAAGLGYSETTWQKFHGLLVRSALLQAAGRARSRLPEGIPLVVLSTEPLRFPVSDAPVQVREGRAQRVFEAILDFTEENCDSGESEDSEIKVPQSTRDVITSQLRSGYSLALSPSDLADRAGVTRPQAHEALVSLCRQGVVHRTRYGQYALGPAPEHIESPVVATVREVAAATPGNTATTADIVQAARTPARTTKRAIGEAHQAGDLVKLAHGVYAPHDQPSEWSSADSQRFELIRDAGDLGMLRLSMGVTVEEDDGEDEITITTHVRDVRG